MSSRPSNQRSYSFSDSSIESVEDAETEAGVNGAAGGTVAAPPPLPPALPQAAARRNSQFDEENEEQVQIFIGQDHAHV
jgi:hypothetical protein